MRIRCVVLALAIALPSSARGQGPAGPFGGLFGRAPERIGKEFTALEFRTGVGAQRDDALVDEVGALGGPTGMTTGGVTAGLVFENRTDRTRTFTRAGATYQEFLRTPRFGATAYDGQAQFIGDVSTRLQVDASLTAQRSPFFELMPQLVPATTTVVDFFTPVERFAVRTLENTSYEGRFGFVDKYSKRSTLSATVSRRETRFTQQSAHDFALWGISGRWSHQLNRELGARLGYGREQIVQHSLAQGEFIHEYLDVGVDYLKEITVARRTLLGFGVQPSMIRETGGPRRYRVNGHASLTRGFRRTWVAALLVNRSTEFLPGFLNPLFMDTAQATLTGMLGRRIEWTAGAGGGRGEVGFDERERFVTYNGTARLSAGVTRYIAVYGQYTLYRYQAPGSASALLLLPQLSRQAVSIGLTTWVPIINRIRTPRDPE